MVLEVESVGGERAAEKAIQNLRRSLSIYKIASHVTGVVLDVSPRSPVDYAYDIRGRGLIGGGSSGGLDIPFFYHPSFDDMISTLSTMCSNRSPADLESRILDAVDVYGLIEDSRPLHVKFMLCVIALEGMLLSKNDKDYL